MITKRYGKKIETVTPDFNPAAMNEISCRRDNAWSEEVEAFNEAYERTGEQNLTASSEGDMQKDVESTLLSTLLGDLRALEAAQPEGSVLMVENESGVDYPRLHSTQRTIVV